MAGRGRFVGRGNHGREAVGRGPGAGRDGGRAAGGRVAGGRTGGAQPASAIAAAAQCSHGSKCFLEHCVFTHNVAKCAFWENCDDFRCSLRHGKDRKRPCRFAGECKLPKGECKFLHPRNTAEKSKCTFDAKCTRSNCSFKHSVDKCAKWENCSDQSCPKRHSADRKLPCKYGKLCNRSDCGFLHPPECKETRCLRCLCSNHHKPSPLEALLCEESIRSVPLWKHIVGARMAHIKKIVNFTKKYRDDMITVDPDPQSVAQKQQLLSELRKEGFSLQGQLDFFDAAIAADFNRLAPAGSMIKNSKQFKVFLERSLREMYRLKNALPALALRKNFESVLVDNQFLVVKGETGSGKSTQLPQYLLEMMGGGRRVLCTQPRKVAAMTLAARVAYEWAAGDASRSSIGGVVGFNTGVTQALSDKTKIEFHTESAFLPVLFQAMEQPTLFADVGAIILDEAHERAITCDLILSILKEEAPQKWPHLKVIVSSATLDTDLFASFLSNCPVMAIPGRLFPIDVEYRPVPGVRLGAGFDSVTALRNAVDFVWNLHTQAALSDGDVLCFLPNQEDVEKAKELLQTRAQHYPHKHKKNCVVLVLHAEQTDDEQLEVFLPTSPETRKIIFSTNVAEASVTINGVCFVVDCGLAMENVFDTLRNVTVQQIDAISRASADQRKGRAGRTAPGVCFRLYSEEEYETMRMTQTPEVLAKPLPLTMVTLLTMGLAQPQLFNWMQSPPRTAMISAMEDLLLLGAVQPITKRGDHYMLTELGKFIFVMQMDPRLAKMIHCAAAKRLAGVACDLAAVLSVAHTLFWQVSGSDKAKREMVNAKHREISSIAGDPITLYRLYSQWMQMLNDLARATSSFDDASLLCGEDGLLVESDELVELNDSADMEDDELAREFAAMRVRDERRRETAAIEDEFEEWEKLEEETEDWETMSTLSDISSAVSLSDKLQCKEDAAELRHRTLLEASKRRNANSWCTTRFLNAHSLRCALSTAKDLRKQLASFEAGMLAAERIIAPSDEELQRIFFDGFFINLAVKTTEVTAALCTASAHAINNATTAGSSYAVVKRDGEAEIMCTFSNSSSMAQHAFFPELVAFQSLLSASRTFMSVCIPVSETWLGDLPPSFRTLVNEKLASHQRLVVRFGQISPALAANIVGRGGRRKRDFERQHHCTMQYDEKNFLFEVSCPTAKCNVSTVQEAMNALIAAQRALSLEEKEEDLVIGNVRAVFGGGFEAEQLLFPGEFLSLIVENIPHGTEREDLLTFIHNECLKNDSSLRTKRRSDFLALEILESDTCAPQAKGASPPTISAVVHLRTAELAAKLLPQLQRLSFRGMALNARPVGASTSSAPVTNAKFELTWAISRSLGEAYVDFEQRDAANAILRRDKNWLRSDLRRLGVAVSVRAIGKHIFQKNVVKGPQNKLPAIDNNGHFVRDETVKSFRLRFVGLNPKIDEKDIEEALVALLSLDAYLGPGRSTRPINVFVKREKLDDRAQEAAMNPASLAFFVNLIPLPNKVAHHESFLDPRNAGRGGLRILYKSVEDADAAAMVWRRRQLKYGSLEHHEQEIRFEMQYSCNVAVYPAVWNALQRNISQTISSLIEEFPNALILQKEPRAKDIGRAHVRKTILILAKTHEIVDAISKRLHTLLDPSAYAPQEDEKHLLFSPVGVNAVKNLCKGQRACHMHCDTRKNTVYVYGATSVAKKAAIDALRRSLADLRSQFNVFCFNLPTAQAKTQFVFRWRAVRERFAEHIVHYKMQSTNANNRVVEFFGTEQGKRMVEQWLRENKLLDTRKEKDRGVAEEVPIRSNIDDEHLCSCFVCFAQGSEVENMFFYGACDHGGCLSCMEEQFGQATNKQDMQIPLVCPMCRTKIALSDVRKISKSEALVAIKDVSIGKYMLTHADSVKYCPKPGCNNILSLKHAKTAVTNKDEAIIGGKMVSYCDLCEKNYCMSCSGAKEAAVLVHCGETCAEKQSGKRAGQQFENHILDNILTLRSPCCNRAMLDWSGCCAVACATCSGRYFCGICFTACGDSSCAHEHVRNCPSNPENGNYFVSDANLVRVHVNYKLRKLTEYFRTIPMELKEVIFDRIEPLIQDLNCSKAILLA